MGGRREVKRVAGLLRAVNVGGRKVLMADLRRVAAEAGFDAPETLLASGNVVFGTDLAPRAAADRLEAAILEEIGVATDVMVRDRAELQAVMAGNPFPRQAKDEPGRLAVVFLSGAPEGDLASLQPACTMGEDVRPGPGCLYIWYPQGMGVSKLSNAVLERRLKVRGTARNWNTVGKLRNLLAA
jgi:uncharacterized protein (DUF1697 family)